MEAAAQWRLAPSSVGLNSSTSVIKKPSPFGHNSFTTVSNSAHCSRSQVKAAKAASVSKGSNCKRWGGRGGRLLPLMFSTCSSKRSRAYTKHRVEATSAPAVPAEADKSVGHEISEGSFDWMGHWYPVSLLEDLDPALPTPCQLLGKDIVLWRDSSGTWQAFLDFCPHRLAPLSEGRLDENGWLQCSYHGWSFKGDGSCGVIPQASTEGPEAKAAQNPRACAVALPVQTHQGMLFVWPDEKAKERAFATPLPSLPPQFEDPSFSTVTIQRDLFYGYDTLMENVSDPSHIDFAHHKVTGRRERAKPMPLKMEESGPWGFKGRGAEGPREGASIAVEFIAPCFYVNTIDIPRGDKTWTVVIASYNIPMAPGKTRSIVLSARNFFRFLVPGPNWWNVLPRWMEHMTSNKVYDGDMIVLQGQEKILQQLSAAAASGHDDEVTGGATSPEYTRLTFTPTGADRYVLAFRNWLRKYGGGEPKWSGGLFQPAAAPLPSTMKTKREMLDRLTTHTEKCASCRRALDSIKKGQVLLMGTMIVLLAAAAIPPAMSTRAILAGSALLCYAGAFLLKKWEAELTFIDYVHAKID